MSEDPATSMYRKRPGPLTTDVGDGPPVVFAHGTLMDRTMFAPQLSGLADAYRCVAYDLRARTEWYAPAYDLEDLANDCAALLDGIGEERAVVAGMSMGGFMALRFALQYPDRVAGLVLIDSMATPHTESERETYGDMVDSLPDRGTVEPHLAEAVTHYLFGETTLAERTDLVDRWLNRWQTYPGEAVYNEVHSWLDRPDVTDRLAEIEAPVLIVHGEEDASIAPERAEAMVDELPDAEFVTIPEAGHSSNLERPELVTEAIGSFLPAAYGEPER